MVAWAYMLVHLLCPSVTLWWTGYSFLHLCSISVLPIGGLGILVPMHATFQCSLFRYLIVYQCHYVVAWICRFAGPCPNVVA